ncbi:hypothetical protein OIU77_000015 [Salix suchowensis]|uniref:Uncharacterized protein n=1 Tax=Salix suchowensis TaxID=1278906 RepID=A0ABQ9B7W0_9ROSI|nr:hypothetical protein OIU77_000015 [Salix suchowensis]
MPGAPIFNWVPIISVSRKADQLAGKSFRARSSRVNKKAIVKMPCSSSSRLQWRILPHQNHQLQPMKRNKIPIHYLERVRLLDFEYAFPNFEVVL